MTEAALDRALEELAAAGLVRWGEFEDGDAPSQHAPAGAGDRARAAGSAGPGAGDCGGGDACGREYLRHLGKRRRSDSQPPLAARRPLRRCGTRHALVPRLGTRCGRKFRLATSTSCAALLAKRSRPIGTDKPWPATSPRPTPAMPDGSATSRSRTTGSATCCVAQGNLPAALTSYRASPRHQRAPGQGRPRQCRMAARPLGLARQDRRRAAGAGQPAGGARELPRLPRHRRTPGQGRPRQCRMAARPLGPHQQDRRRAGGAGRTCRRRSTTYQASPRHPRAPGQGRPRQCRMAARPLGLARQDRRRAAGAGRTCRRRWRPTGPPSPSQSAWPRPTRAMPDGSATSRSRIDRIGDVLLAQGEPAGGADELPRRLAIAERLAKADPAMPDGSVMWRCRSSARARSPRSRGIAWRPWLPITAVSTLCAA